MRSYTIKTPKKFKKYKINYDEKFFPEILQVTIHITQTLILSS